jgi:hypothetical protein
LSQALRCCLLVVVLGTLGPAGGGCARNKAGVEVRDDFERAEVGPAWINTGGPYRIENGELRVQGARNSPLWLAEPLPPDVEVTFTARSLSPSGDIKFELFGDGRSKAHQASYVATGYVLIFGGWHNRRSMIARQDEHGPAVVARSDVKVEPGRTYRMRVLRRGDLLQWFIDGELFLAYRDPAPLFGPDNRHFAFNNWESELVFDDLVIRPVR